MLSFLQGQYPYEGEEDPDLINAGEWALSIATHVVRG